MLEFESRSKTSFNQWFGEVFVTSTPNQILTTKKKNMSCTSDTLKGKKKIMLLIDKVVSGKISMEEAEKEADTIATEMWNDGRSHDSGWDSD